MPLHSCCGDVAELESGDLHEVCAAIINSRNESGLAFDDFSLLAVARKTNENLPFSEAGKEPTSIPMAMATRSVSHFGATTMQWTPGSSTPGSPCNVSWR